MDRDKFIYALIVVILAAGFLYVILGIDDDVPDDPVAPAAAPEYVAYKNSEYGPEFVYPPSWGEPAVRAGNSSCPEEDTYRTPETLSVYDWEISFPEKKLPGSESFIRTGIRLYELDPENPNGCGDDFLLSLAKKTVAAESISSFRLQSLTLPSGLEGVYNPEASRLNTEARTQYTFFISGSGFYYILQPYTSFIPYFGSPELLELEQNYAGDMEKYLSEGVTSAAVRTHRRDFNIMSESLKFGME